MTVNIITRKALPLLFMVVGLTSCINEYSAGPGEDAGGGSALVKLELKVPGSTVPVSRALQPQQEDEVSEIIVFAFEKGSGNHWDTPLKHVGKSIGSPQGEGTTKQFTVELYSGEWDLWVLANSKNLIDDLQALYDHTDIYSEAFIDLGLNKSDLQAGVTKTVTGKWNVDANDADGSYRIPMWGMINAVQVKASSTDIIKTVNLYRMVVKIDVEVQRTESPGNPDKYPGIPLSQFELTYVSLHNYNTRGRLVPGVTAEDGNWATPNGGIALKTSLPADPGGVYGWESHNRLEWSHAGDLTTDGTALNGVIYTFETDSGTHSGNRPCIIIGGKYNGSQEVTYYRADFFSANKKYLNLLRNHKYKFTIRRIDGKGFSSVEDAYRAGPTNLEAEVIEWNEGGYMEGVWNGTHEIRFSDTSVHFTQFGTPGQHIITVRSNVPTLTFGNFTDFASGQGDGNWQLTAEDNWSNSHFNVKAEKVATMGEYSDYALTITANPANTGDPIRQSTFIIKGYMLEVEITISQDNHMTYRLQTSPDPTVPISIDGVRQLVKIEIMSTHPYKIDFKGYPMFLNIYEDATGTSLISDRNNIPATTNRVYIEVDAHTSQEARVGEFFIRHVTTDSDAPARLYSLLQMSPIITAELEEGGYSGRVSKSGGSKTIVVQSNLAAWRPVLTIDGVLHEGDLSEYFNIINGVQSQEVVFTVPGMTVQDSSDKVYSIDFRDINNTTQTEHPITITQKAVNGTPPTTGVKAPAYILAVNADGELNLDGDGYIVYFKWGSLIGITGSPDAFDSSQIAWAPDGYDISVIGNDWSNIQYATTIPFPATDPASGLGDPCTLASRNGVKGGWKMPTGSTWFEALNTRSDGWVNRSIQGTYVNGRLNYNGTMFYPAAGKRTASGLTDKDVAGNYWIATPSGSNNVTANALYFDKGFISNGIGQGRAVAMTIRCIQN